MSRNRLCSWKILVRINGLLKALLRHLYVKTLRMGISMSLDTSQVSIRVIGIMTMGVPICEVLVQGSIPMGTTRVAPSVIV